MSPNREAIFAEIRRREDFGSLNPRQIRIVDELRRRGAFPDSASPPTADPVTPERATFLTENRVDPAAFEALTPGKRSRVLSALGQQSRSPQGAAVNHDLVGESIGDQLSYIPTAPARSVASGVTQSGLSTMSLMRRGAEFAGLAEAGGADTLTRAGAAVSRGNREANRDSWTPEMLNTAIEGASRSIADLVTLAGAGRGVGLTGKLGASASVITGFATKAANDAMVRGADAGLQGGELAAYALGQGAIEGSVTAAFQAVGLGGFESLAAPVKQTVKSGLKYALVTAAKRFGVSSIAELPEELIVGAASKVAGYVQGVESDALLTPEEVAQTALTTILSVGAGQAGRGMGAALRGAGEGQQGVVDERVPDPQAEQQVMDQAGPDTTQGDGPTPAAPQTQQEARPEDAAPQEAQPVVEGDRRQASTEVTEDRRQADRRSPDLQKQRADIAAMFEKGDKDAANAAIAEIQDKARRDPKGTGLLSGVVFDDQVADIQADVDASGESRYVSMLDVGNLGLSNTVRGHLGADQDLQRVASAVLEVAGPEASFRTGGDEQSIIWPPGTTEAEAKAGMKKIEKAVGFDEIVPGASLFVAGGTGAIVPGGDIKETLSRIDEESETRKKQIKARRGEKASVGKEEAARLAAETKKKTTREHVRAATPIEGTSHKRRVPASVEQWLTPLASRVRDISPAVFDRLMRMHFDADTARERLKKELHDPAGRITGALKEAGKSQDFKFHVLNQQFEEARELLRGIDPALVNDFEAFAMTFKNLLDNQRDAGVDIGEIGQYWPRSIKDYKSFTKEFGKDVGMFEEAWEQARRVKGRRVLTAEEKADIANSVLQGYGPRKPGSFGAPHARARSIDTVSREALDHYADPMDAAFQYVDSATYAAERSRFLGSNHTGDDLDETVGRIVQQEIEAGRLDPAQQQELHDLLKSRFTADMATTSKGVRAIKQLTYLTTLSQFRSAITQLTDMAMTVADHGLVSTVRGAGMALRLTGKDRREAMEDIGMHTHGEEFRDVGKLARATDWALRASGFKALDRLGKETRINAAADRFARAAAQPNSKDRAKLEREYAPVLGRERFEQVMRDYQTGTRTEDTKYLLFLDIARVQPITLSQMPQKYLDMPNGRVMYTLKTFTVMQLDHVRRDMIRKIATPGQRREGLSHLGRYLAMFTMLGLGKDLLQDMLRGELPDPDKIPDQAMDALLGTVGMNRYLVGDAWTNPADAALNFVAPPLTWMAAPWRDVVPSSKEVQGAWSGASWEGLIPGSKPLHSIRYAPIVGDLLYYWSPVGRGYHLTKEQATRDFRGKLRELRRQAAESVRQGDTTQARTLLAIYNERRKQGPGDGRKRPLTFSNLRGDLARQGVKP